jgi:hypothetical protein
MTVGYLLRAGLSIAACMIRAYSSKALRPLEVRLQIVSGYFPLKVFSTTT